jgi:hypothetical protein
MDMLYDTEKEQLELISTARQLLNAEYAKKCTQEYQSWSTVNKNIINRTGEVLLRYPPFSGALSPVSFRSTIAKPTETDVVNLALELYNRNRPSPYQTSAAAVVEPTPEVAAVKEPVSALGSAVVTTETSAAESKALSTEVSTEQDVAEPPMLSAAVPVSPALTDETAKDNSFTGGIFDIFKNTTELVTTVVEPEKTEPVVPTVAAPTSVTAIEAPKDTKFTDRIFDIFKKPSEIPLPEVAVTEADPLTEPVVVTRVEDTRTDFTVEVPAVVVPEPAPTPAPPPQLTNSYTDRVKEIFNDVPKDKPSGGITGMLKRAFSGKKDKEESK